MTLKLSRLAWLGSPLVLALIACGDDDATSRTDASGSDSGATESTGTDATATNATETAGNTNNSGSESDSDSVTVTDTDGTTVGPTTATTSPITDSDSDSDSVDPSSDTDVNCAPQEFACGGECCAPDQVCFQDTCQDDCGGVPPCGPQKDCCGMQEVCYLDSCVVPGGACAEKLCATKDDPLECDDGFVCDPQLGLCVPAKSDPSCVYIPPQNTFEPVPLFTWGFRKSVNCNNDSQCQTAETCENGKCTISWPHITPMDAPTNIQVSSIPLVVDIDDNCIPDVIFNSYISGQASSNGVIRAIRGDTGEPIWSVLDPNYQSDSTANPAVGDIDEDGLPEVVVQGEGKYLIAIDNDGTPLWTSDPFTGAENSGSVAIANLDGEGEPEIIFGAAVYDANGAKIWEGGSGIGHDGQGPISCVADLDGDARPELIGGRTAYTFTGTILGGDFSGSVLWNAAPGDGRCGVADFDLDGQPEVILVRAGNIYALNGQTGATIATANIPGSSDRGGVPNIADFKGMFRTGLSPPNS